MAPPRLGPLHQPHDVQIPGCDVLGQIDRVATWIFDGAIRGPVATEVVEGPLQLGSGFTPTG